jgi:hypothetical protein
MIQKSQETDLTLHFCHVQSRNPPPTLCFSCHPPAGKSLVEMEGKIGITYLKNIHVFKPSSSIKKISFDCSYVVAHSGVRTLIACLSKRRYNNILHISGLFYFK